MPASRPPKRWFVIVEDRASGGRSEAYLAINRALDGSGFAAVRFLPDQPVGRRPETLTEWACLAAAELERRAHRAEQLAETLIAERRAGGEPHVWIGDDSDDLESLACPVLIDADKLRSLLDDAAASEPGRIWSLSDIQREFKVSAATASRLRPHLS